MTKSKPGRPSTALADIVKKIPKPLWGVVPQGVLQEVVAQMEASLRWMELTDPDTPLPPGLSLEEQKAALEAMYEKSFLPELQEFLWFPPAEGYHYYRAALLAAFAASPAAVRVVAAQLPKFLNGVEPWDERLSGMVGNPDVPAERQTLAVAREVVGFMREHYEACAADPESNVFAPPLDKTSAWYGEQGAELLAGLFALGARSFFDAYAAGKLKQSRLTKKQRQRADAALARLREDASQDEAES
ncbi:hypothetical protein FACS1894116_09300 [Betaproteobacteria bacterium]|nr:hypothetical protein FACS1894116_09300 [Betaproteobacteria bacterium]GHT98749.1 hypothetical protein FACS1894154_04570 [Betaproteobacteria bacterium]GHU29644.1 hypothetical protein FACS189497_07980 [Betaproteobacteria bacterium]